MLKINFLVSKGATFKEYKMGSFIFKQGTKCRCYHQLVTGSVSWENVNSEGKTLSQYLVNTGECFGELPLFDGEPYVADAVAKVNSLVIRLPYADFISLLHEYPEIHFKFSKLLSHRVRQKFTTLSIFAFKTPESRILFLLKGIKVENGTPLNKSTKLDLTRQEIANLTGLRVETVIRAIKNLSEKGELQIKHGKVFY
ncbi:MAG: Crp/Fnr family transcriptional regulator [Bacteroidia bacterium]